MTPTIERLVPPSVSARPRTDGSAPNRRRQNASLMTMTGGPPKRSSCGVGRRPSAGPTPRTWKNRGDVFIAATRSGTGPEVSVMFSK
jgi:hypothetical protein